jgi:hypothetical protein
VCVACVRAPRMSESRLGGWKDEGVPGWGAMRGAGGVRATLCCRALCLSHEGSQGEGGRGAHHVAGAPDQLIKAVNTDSLRGWGWGCAQGQAWRGVLRAQGGACCSVRHYQIPNAWGAQTKTKTKTQT